MKLKGKVALVTGSKMMNAFKTQFRYFIRLMVDGYNVVGSLHATRLPTPFASATIDDCIANVRSIQEGGAKYSVSGCFMTGLANTADSLAAIENSVFRDKIFSLKELSEILKTDFKDRERIRQLLLNKMPKYGNDDDYVDGLARECVAVYAKELEKYQDSRGADLF